MTKAEDHFKRIISHCKEYGFIYPSSEIYDGLSAVYDYGPMGVLLKNNLKDYWWRSMVQCHDNIVGIDSAIFMHPTIWKASGHVDAFNDPLIDNKDSKKRYRADQLIEDAIDKIQNKIDKEVAKAQKRFGDDFDTELFLKTNPRVVGYREKIDGILAKLNACLSKNDLVALRALFDELDITDPESGSRNWTDIRQFNLMFSTQLGNIAGSESKLYLRPETAQGIFVNYLNVQKTARQKIPFGIAQIGKAFRNEIVARQFIFRMREFEQMEMQYFVRPGEEMQAYEYWKDKRMKWHIALGTEPGHLQFYDHENLAHYANAAVDVQYKFPFGFKELEGIHSRTDFDLVRHEEYSGKKLQYFDPSMDKNYVPYVVETSIGCDRLFLTMLSEYLLEEEVPDAKGNSSTRTVLKLHPAITPMKCAVLPLVKNNTELVSLAKKIFNELKLEMSCQYDEKDAIGRRYRRQDAIGTAYCVTVDFESLEDGCVTVRDRDSLKQTRTPIAVLAEQLRRDCSMTNLLKQIEN